LEMRPMRTFPLAQQRWLRPDGSFSFIPQVQRPSILLEPMEIRYEFA
jgi:hypothetical protein